MDEKLAFTPATEMRELIATKQVSPVEITELYFDRIERLDSQLNSYLTLDRDGAMKTAKAAEEAVIRGDELALLHGIPISVKDLEMTKGIRTTRGSLVHKDDVPDVDSPVVERVRQAGAVILGKTNCSEFGALGVNQNLLGDHCRNPWNTDRTTGASSGGAGAAMAASLCSLATGGDGGGSIRIPCSFCGIYGIKPTQGRVPKYVAPGAPYAINLFAQSGPMTRTVRDSALLLQAMAGYHPMDPTTMRETPPDFMAAVDRDIKGLRIAWSPDFGYAGVEPEVAEVTAAAATVFEELGCSVEESNLDLEGSWDTYWPISAASQLSAGGHLLEKAADQLTWYVREGIEAGLDVSGMDYARALAERSHMRQQMADLFQKYDLLLSPTMPLTALSVEGFPEEIGGKPVYPNPHMGFIPFTHPVNVVGNTAASIPCGFSSDGMPIGLHIIGPTGDEETVLAASAAFEQARPWIQHRPPVS